MHLFGHLIKKVSYMIIAAMLFANLHIIAYPRAFMRCTSENRYFIEHLFHKTQFFLCCTLNLHKQLFMAPVV